MMATPSPRSVCTILHDFWCRVIILSVSSPNEPKSRVFPPNVIQILPYTAAGTEIYINEEKAKRVDSFFQRTVSPRIEENTTIEEENKEQLRDENPPPISAIENPTFLSIQRDPGDVQKLIRVIFKLNEEPSANTGQNAFAINGFKNWNMVKGKHWHIDQVMQRLTDEEVRLNRFIIDIVIVIGASCKRQDELQAAQAAQIEEMLQTGEIESGKGASQIGTVKQDKKDGLNFKTRGGASSALKKLTSFDFVFILHMMKTILGHADVLCKALQQKDQEVVRRSVRNQDDAPNEHHYHFDIYNETIDFQLRELDSRFSEKIMELLELSFALDPRDGYVSFNSHSILKLAKKYYYLDFTEQELDDMEFQLKHFELDIKDHPVLGKSSSIAHLCQGLSSTGKESHY
ncbi:zinc finger MYM-type protein 1-like protein [Tanacetum coccineum]